MPKKRDINLYVNKTLALEIAKRDQFSTLPDTKRAFKEGRIEEFIINMEDIEYIISDKRDKRRD
ncbi:MAG: hypothetical protein FIB07_07715 [Candidatus Methanoperedens sp.]|nr:hypothetical protein [Candidatus Methanoperedens sp.]